MSDDNGGGGGVVSDLVRDTFGNILKSEDEHRSAEAKPAPEPPRDFPAFPADLAGLSTKQTALALALWYHTAQHSTFPSRPETVVRTARAFEGFLMDGADARSGR